MRVRFVQNARLVLVHAGEILRRVMRDTRYRSCAGANSNKQQGRKPVMSIGGDLNSARSAEKFFFTSPQNLNLGGDELSNTKL